MPMYTLLTTLHQFLMSLSVGFEHSVCVIGSGESRRNDTAGLTWNQIPFPLTDLNHMKKSDQTLNQTICSVKILPETYGIHVYFLSFFFFFILSWFIRLFIVVFYLFYWLSLLTYEETYNEGMRWWWYRIRVRACQSGCCVCDSIWKVPTISHLKGVEPFPTVTFPEMLMVGPHLSS